MLRFLLVVVLFLVLLRFLSRLAGVVLRALHEGAALTPSRTATPPAIALVRCTRCGVYVPQTMTRAGGAHGSPDAAVCRACAGD